MTVVTAQTVWDDLLDIGRLIASDSPRHAEALLERAYNAHIGIGQKPEALERVPRLGSRIRRRRVANHLIFYRAHEADVEILQVIHGGREYERLLLPEREQD